MANSAATLQCPNHQCQAANPQNEKFCTSCGTPLIKRYLWAIRGTTEAGKIGEKIADRYQIVDKGILLDTTPAVPPDTPEEVPPDLLPYLKLSPYQLHVPQVYGKLTWKGMWKNSEIWLLEDAPIQQTDPNNPSVKLWPELVSLWQSTGSVRQLNWLSQWANLWEPCLKENVATSLLQPSLIRVEGSLLRLLELQSDRKVVPTLPQLGQLWLNLIDGASPDIQRFLRELCSQLRDGQITTSDRLVTVLNRGLYDCGRSQNRTYQIFTATDSGPSRDHNEDACYPASGDSFPPTKGNHALAIVCDGIGGHEGGEVASQLAIDTLRQRVEILSDTPENWNPNNLSWELEQATCAANDAISVRNDSEHRSDRQRMGTTLVMAKTFAHEIYITHVGDSRVYWVTKQGCHQVTQDDDLASREVRLGYALYRHAVQHRSSGSLVQALGMASSATLHPTVQRFVVDEDCIFLLCSDGLSDYDRVDQYWQKYILPILEGQIDLPTAAEELINIANTKNGHDNVTIALVYATVSSYSEIEPTELSPPQREAIAPTQISGAIIRTQQISTQGKTRRPWWLFLGIIVLLGTGGVLASIFFGGFDRVIDLAERLTKRVDIASTKTVPDIASVPENSPNTDLSGSETSPSTATSSVPSLVPISELNVQNLTEAKDLIRLQGKNISLVTKLDKQSEVRVITTGSVLQVIESKNYEKQEWLLLKVCSINYENVEPGVARQGKKIVAEGDRGFVKVADVLVDRNFQPTPQQRSECGGEN